MGTAVSKTPFSEGYCIMILVGLNDVGLTSAWNRLTRPELPGGMLPETIPTIGSNVKTISYKNNRITLWEMGGHEKIRPLWRSYIWHGHAFMFVVNASSPVQFLEARDELQRLHTTLSEKTDNKYSLLVVANKMDKPGASPRHLRHCATSLNCAEVRDFDRIL
ncbi:ADP-ribosylation factor 1-like protein [Mycena maculata]|uniref:ADP-ribosylation factor 1-like protein n=1 Tax=Mycena maculata TaxID=230809 RepID=A0AAD7I5T0_9AGAR|nr:ADP-ribosylation factor 1-like protein [Mycena maculata]